MNNVEGHYDEALRIWVSFKKEILYKNRYFIDHDILQYVKTFAERNKAEITNGTILYRARLYIPKKGNPNQQLIDAIQKQSGFWGYGKEDSFVPLDNDLISDGRVNPAFISYLYTAENAYTALAEVRPYLESKVSVAEILTKETLNIADFCNIEGYDGLELCIIYLIMNEFSQPSNLNKKDYIATQYIAEYIKNLGFDGIRFSSSLYQLGRNVTIFNPEKCEPISSKLYEVKDICFHFKGISPQDEKDIVHHKLRDRSNLLQKKSD